MWGRENSGLEVLHDPGVGDGVRAKHLEEGLLILNHGVGGVLVELNHVEVGAIHSVAVDEVGSLEVPQDVLEVGVLTGLEPPQIQFGTLHTSFQSRGQ